jgi:hypothetical protein
MVCNLGIEQKGFGSSRFHEIKDFGNPCMRPTIDLLTQIGLGLQEHLPQIEAKPKR